MNHSDSSVGNASSSPKASMVGTHCNHAVQGDFLHKEYPKQFDRSEFWRQIKRTVNGKPVSDSDISLIISQIDRLLDFHPNDHLLDLGCGNGALASRLFAKITKYTGVDFSKYLLDVAAEFFQPNSQFQYVEADIRNVDRYVVGNETVTKVLVYGCIAYLSKADVESTLIQLRSKLPQIQSVMLGNIPNLERATEFFELRNISTFETNDPQSQIGVWWSLDEMIEMAKGAGFSAEIHQMPVTFYGHKYRFDVVLRTGNSICQPV